MPNPGDGGVGYSWFAVEVVSEYVPEPEPTPDLQHGGGKHGAYGPVKRPERKQSVTFAFSAEVRVEFERVGASFSAVVPGVRQVGVSLSGQVSASRRLTTTFSAERGAAENWNAALRDEEEILLSL